MKNKIVRIIVLILAVCLMVTMETGAAIAAKKLNEIINVDQYTAAIDTSLSCDDAFAKANSAYKKGQYDTAKSYYLLALKNIKQTQIYSQGEICNNLALSMLQLEENDAAYDLFRYILENKMMKTNQDRFGAMMNLLVAAHANGIPAAKELSDAANKGYFRFKDLAGQQKNKPGTFTKLLTGLIYNVLYIDMEHDIYDGAASFYYFPEDRLKSVSLTDVMKSLAKLTGGKAEPKDKATFEKVNKKTTRNEYLKYIKNVLKKANTWNKNTYGETDPDIDELLKYLEVLRSR